MGEDPGDGRYVLVTCRRNPYRVYRGRCLWFMKNDEAPHGWIDRIPMSVQRPPVTEERLVVRQRAQAELVADVKGLTSRKVLLVPLALEKLDEFRRANARDCIAATKGAQGHI